MGRNETWCRKWFKSDGIAQTFICHSFYYYLFSFSSFIFYDRQSIIRRCEKRMIFFIHLYSLLVLLFCIVLLVRLSRTSNEFKLPLLIQSSILFRGGLLLFAVNLDCIFRVVRKYLKIIVLIVLLSAFAFILTYSHKIHLHFTFNDFHMKNAWWFAPSMPYARFVNQCYL